MPLFRTILPIACALLLVSPAFAETSQQIAEAHFRTGLKLYEQSKYEEARLSFLQAHSVYPRASILRNLALCELKTNRPLEAIQHLRTYLADPAADMREFAQKNLDDAMAMTGHINVQATEGSTLVVDGKPQLQHGSAPFKEALDMLPGTHVVEARLGDRSRQAEVDAPAGSVVEVDLRFEQPAVLPAETAQPIPAPNATLVLPPTEDRQDNRRERYLVSGSLAALGIVGVGVGIGFTVAANNAADDVTKARSSSGTYACTNVTNGDCDSRGRSAASRARSSNIAVGSYVGGGILVATGVVTYLMWPKTSKRSASLVPWVGKDGAGLAYGKEF
jgi:hypothetical protein